MTDVTDSVRPAISTKLSRESRKDGTHTSMPSSFRVEHNEWNGSILKRGLHPAVLLFSDERPQVISCHSFFVDSVAVWSKNNMFIQCITM